MNKQIPTTEALDEQERELARVLRALPGGEPPAALDARILKAAGNAAAASRRPRTRWIASAGALWGIGGAAAAVLALGVSLQLMYPAQHSMRPESAPAARMEDKAEDSTVSVELKDQQASEPGNAPAASPALKSATPAPAAQAYSAAPSAAPPPAPMTADLPEPFASEHLDEHVTSSADLGASADERLPCARGRRPLRRRSSNAVQAAPAAKAAAESQMAQRAAASDAAADRRLGHEVRSRAHEAGDLACAHTETAGGKSLRGSEGKPARIPQALPGIRHPLGPCSADARMSLVTLASASRFTLETKKSRFLAQATRDRLRRAGACLAARNRRSGCDAQLLGLSLRHRLSIFR